MSQGGNIFYKKNRVKMDKLNIQNLNPQFFSFFSFFFLLSVNLKNEESINFLNLIF